MFMMYIDVWVHIEIAEEISKKTEVWIDSRMWLCWTDDMRVGAAEGGIDGWVSKGDGEGLGRQDVEVPDGTRDGAWCRCTNSVKNI